jgi:hypothetical protein
VADRDAGRAIIAMAGGDTIITDAVADATTATIAIADAVPAPLPFPPPTPALPPARHRHLHPHRPTSAATVPKCRAGCYYSRLGAPCCRHA